MAGSPAASMPLGGVGLRASRQECRASLGHTLTFLQLHALEVEGVPQDVAAAWLVLLGEEQQVGVGKERHLHHHGAH